FRERGASRSARAPKPPRRAGKPPATGRRRGPWGAAARSAHLPPQFFDGGQGGLEPFAFLLGEVDALDAGGEFPYPVAISEACRQFGAVGECLHQLALRGLVRGLGESAVEDARRLGGVSFGIAEDDRLRQGPA